MSSVSAITSYNFATESMSFPKYLSHHVISKDPSGATQLALHNCNPFQAHRNHLVAIQNASEPVGESLVKVDTPKNLFRAIIGAMLGYRSLLEKGYHHRDVNIRNVLWFKDAKETGSIFDALMRGPNITQEQRNLLDLLKRYGMDKQYTGCLNDGDMVVNLKTCSPKEGTYSGTDEFMSTGLRRAMAHNTKYFQSPLDDLWSFYWVAQWAAVFNSHEFLEDKVIPEALLESRKLVSGTYTDRSDVGFSIRELHGREKQKYGAFLVDCQPILKSWYHKLVLLNDKWNFHPVANPGDIYATYYPKYKTAIDQGIIDLLQIVLTRFPDGA